MGKKRFQRHFRRVRTPEYQGHIGYAFEKKDKNFRVVGLTSDTSYKGIYTLPLEKNPNPNPGKKKKSYLKPYIDVVGPKGKIEPTWSFSEKDLVTVEKVIQNNYSRDEYLKSADYKKDKKVRIKKRKSRARL